MRDDLEARADLEYGVIPRLVRTASRRYASREAVVEGRTRVSYAELGARVEVAAAACIASGVAPGDRVALWAPNTLDWIVSALGAVTAGAVLVPVNTRFKGTEAAYVLRRTRAKLLFVTGTFLGTSYVASLRRAAKEGSGRGPLPGLPQLEKVVVLSDDAPADFTTWQDFLMRRRGGVAGDGPRPGRRPAPRRPLGHHLHLRHHRPSQGRGDHPCADPARLRRLERSGRPPGGRPLSDRQPVLPHLRLQGRDHRLSAARRDDDPAAGLQRGDRARQYRRRADLRTPRTAHPPPADPRPPRPRPARPLGAAPGRHRSRRGPPGAGRAAAQRAEDLHGPDGIRAVGELGRGHDVPPRRSARGHRHDLGPGPPRHRGPGRRRLRRPPAARRPRRGAGARLPRDVRLLRGPGRHGPGDHPRRLAVHRRCGRPRRGRQPPHHRPHQGHVHRRRLQRLSRRNRATPRTPSGHRRRRRHRHTRPPSRRGRQGLCGPPRRLPRSPPTI